MSSLRKYSEVLDDINEVVFSSKDSRKATATQFILALADYEKENTKGYPGEATVKNLIERVKKIVWVCYNSCQVAARLEARHVSPRDPSGDFLLKMDNFHADLRAMVRNHLADVKEEMQLVVENIAEQATNHIHRNEIITTIGYSSTLLKFFEKAHKDNTFHVVVAESEPATQAHQMAKELGEAGIDTTLIPHSNIYAMMSRVNKVIIGTEAITANGGLIAYEGTHGLCLAAQQHSVPVIVCGGLYKISPEIPVSYELDTFTNMGPASGIVDHAEGDMVHNANCIFPIFDYVPPGLVEIIVTNSDSYSPATIFRAVESLYFSH